MSLPTSTTLVNAYEALFSATGRLAKVPAPASQIEGL
jgi:hypothetical protein